MHQVLVNHLVKLAEEKVWLGDCPDMTIAVDWDIKHQTKQTKQKHEHLCKILNVIPRTFIKMCFLDKKIMSL